MSEILEKQVGGSHYKQFKIQPMQMAELLQLCPTAFSAFKYACRLPFKENMLEDLEKMKHCLELFIELAGVEYVAPVQPSLYIDFLNQFDEFHGRLIHTVITFPEHQNFEDIQNAIDDFLKNREVESGGVTYMHGLSFTCTKRS